MEQETDLEEIFDRIVKGGTHETPTKKEDQGDDNAEEAESKILEKLKTNLILAKLTPMVLLSDTDKLKYALEKSKHNETVLKMRLAQMPRTPSASAGSPLQKTGKNKWMKIAYLETHSPTSGNEKRIKKMRRRRVPQY